MKRFAIYIGVGFLILLIFLAVFTQTAVFRKLLKEQLTTQLNPFLQADLSIGRLNGNLFTRVVLEDLTLVQEGDTLLNVPRLRVAFRPLSLLHRQVVVRVLDIDDIQLFLVQRPDSTWNWQNIVVSADSPADADTAQSPSPWRIDLNRANLNRARIQLQPLDPLPRGLPSQIDLQARLTLKSQSGSLEIDLEHLRLTTPDQSAAVDSIMLRMALRDQVLDIPVFSLHVGGSHLQARGWIKLERDFVFALEIDGKTLHTEDWIWLPPLPKARTFDTHLELQADGRRGDGRLVLQSGRESLQLQTDFVVLPGQRSLAVNGEIHSFDLGLWSHAMPQHGATDAQFIFNADKVASKVWKLEAHAQIDSFRLEDLVVQKTVLQAEGRVDSVIQNLDCRIKIESNAIMAEAVGSLQGERFDLETRFNNIDLSAFTGDEKYKSDLAGRGEIHGRGIRKGKLEWVADVELASGSISGIAVDTLACRAIYRQTILNLPWFLVESEALIARASGWIGRRQEGEIEFYLRPGRLENLTFLQDTDILRLEGRIDGTLGGRLDSLLMNSRVDLFNLAWQSWQIDSLNGPVTILLHDSQPTAKVNLLADGVRFDDRSFAKLRLNGEASADSADLQLLAEHVDSLRLDLHAGIRWMPHLSLTISHLHADVYGSEWRSQEKIYLSHRDSLWQMSGVNLLSGSESLLLNGVYRPLKRIEINLRLLDTDLQLVNRFYPDQPHLDGRVSLIARISGTPMSPRAEVEFSVDHLTLAKTALGRLSGQATADSGKLSSRLDWQNDDFHLLITGDLPLAVDLTAQSPVELHHDQPLQLLFEPENVDLSAVRHLSDQLTRVQGRLDGRLQVGNSLEDPSIDGFLRLRGGRVNNPTAGMDYRDIRFNLHIVDQEVILDSAQIIGGGGILRLQGNLVYQGDPEGVRVEAIDLQAGMDNFLAVENRTMTLRLDGKIGISGTMDKPQLQGRMSILRSRFNLEGQTASAQAAPRALLVQSSEAADGQKESSPSADYFEKLRGTVQVSIPRNTWIRSPEMNMEISGDVAVVKTGQGFELFGSIQTLRGAYELYGKRFSLQKGRLEFLGGDRIDPQLDIEALYIFRDLERQKRRMTLLLQGTLEKPDFTFSLDGLVIEEKDAFAYLLFGRGFEALTTGQRSELGEKEGGLLSQATVTNVLAGQLAEQLTARLRSGLDLDVIEFSSEQDWRQATLLIGKYLTNDLFISYERTLSLGGSAELVPEKINLEYEIGRNWYLQATKSDEKSTGFDLIWKLTRP
ncbi:translocation/assembly module TamB domain-containing protein [candidate division KSB1 bacterium]|nr:translocation/assembly module TamB domain-containing protein [candidate division KSB1 bacterium]